MDQRVLNILREVHAEGGSLCVQEGGLDERFGRELKAEAIRSGLVKFRLTAVVMEELLLTKKGYLEIGEKPPLCAWDWFAAIFLFRALPR